MSEEQSIVELMEQSGSVQGLQQLLDSKSHSEEEKRLLHTHILLATAFVAMPKERIPESLLNSLYSIEHSSLKQISFVSLRDILYSLFYVVAAAAGIFFINGDALSGESMVVFIVILSSASGFFFYHLFKSKFLII